MFELRNLSGGYDGRDAVSGVTLDLPDGGITAIIGPNGCGKSTLLKLCAGQIKASGGEAALDGRLLSKLSARETARELAYLPQSRAVPDMRAETLVLHGRFPWLGYPRVYRDEDRRAAVAAMERAGILAKRSQPLAKLSGGERQKAYIAMALAQDTRHLLLDEPAGYLDIAVQLELSALLGALRQEGRCVVAVTHDIGAALELADQIAVMKEGRLLRAGSPEDILSSGAIEEAFGVKVEMGTGVRFLTR